MGESRLIVEELLDLCLQRITMEENTMTTEQGEAARTRAHAHTHAQHPMFGLFQRWWRW